MIAHRDLPPIHQIRNQLSPGPIKRRMTGSMIHQPTATMPTPHSSLWGIHYVATGTLMTVEVLRQWQIGPLQAKTTGAAVRDARITIEGIQAHQINLDSVIPRKMRYSHYLHGFGSIRGLFSADLHAEKKTPKGLDFSHFLTACIHRHSPSIIKHSAFDYHLAVAISHGGMAFFSFCGRLLWISSPASMSYP